MVSNSASHGHCDNVKPLMSWHESLYNLSRDGVVDDDVLRIAVLDFRSADALASVSVLRGAHDHHRDLRARLLSAHASGKHDQN